MKWLCSSLHLKWPTDEVLGDVTCLLAIFIRGPENLWSPWTGISAPYPCATPLARALALGLALVVLRHSECCGTCEKSVEREKKR